MGVIVWPTLLPLVPLVRKMVMRDVARVRDLPYAEADKLAKMVPDDLNISLDDAIEKSPEFKKEYENNPIAKQIVDTGV
jgi:DNA polymerase-3 subunit alpha